MSDCFAIGSMLEQHPFSFRGAIVASLPRDSESENENKWDDEEDDEKAFVMETKKEYSDSDSTLPPPPPSIYANSNKLLGPIILDSTVHANPNKSLGTDFDGLSMDQCVTKLLGQRLKDSRREARKWKKIAMEKEEMIHALRLEIQCLEVKLQSLLD